MTTQHYVRKGLAAQAGLFLAILMTVVSEPQAKETAQVELEHLNVRPDDDRDFRDFPRRYYERRILVSDKPGVGAHTDPDLVNAWGIAFNPTGFVWVSDGGTGLSTLYDGDGNKNTGLVVRIPTPPGEAHAEVTGIVFNSTGFAVSANGKSGNAAFIFATEQGTISGWSPAVDRNNAIEVVPPSSAVYKGLALAANGRQRLLYATDFFNGKVDVYDDTFKPVTVPGAFKDKYVPAGYAPFGIQAINGDLYVTFAKQNDEKKDDVAGAGFGFLDVFDGNGNLIRRLVTRGRLNAPWGLALAPANFGRFSGRLLIGNFGNGKINAYDLATGEFKGRLTDADGKPIVIDGLWGLSFGNGVLNQSTSALFYTAGPDDETHGEYGRLDATMQP